MYMSTTNLITNSQHANDCRHHLDARPSVLGCKELMTDLCLRGQCTISAGVVVPDSLQNFGPKHGFFGAFCDFCNCLCKDSNTVSKLTNVATLHAPRYAHNIESYTWWVPPAMVPRFLASVSFTDSPAPQHFRSHLGLRYCCQILH